MTTYTSIYALPSPALADAPNVPAHISALATATEAGLTAVAGATGVNNLFINSQFKVDQRGASPATFTTGATDFISDRWLGTSGTGATNTFTRTEIATGSFAGAPRYKMAWNRTVTGSSTSYMRQRVEDVRTAAGQTLTVSFNAAVSSGTTAVTLGVVQAFGTGGSPSSSVVTSGVTNVSITTSTSTRHSVSLNIPSISGKTIGTSTPGYLDILICRATAAGTGTIDFWDMQAVIGTVAPGYVARRDAEELAMCQRYYWQLGPYGATRNLASGYAFGTTVGVYYIPFPATMRIAPTVTFSANNDFTCYGQTGANTTAISLNAATTSGMQVDATTSGLTAGQGLFLTTAQDTTNAAIYINAEP